LGFANDFFLSIVQTTTNINFTFPIPAPFPTWISHGNFKILSLSGGTDQIHEESVSR
jgi:hypothetical protein